jgi:ATP-binding cassette subfamily C (CFTR/MRP) protein 1
VIPKDHLILEGTIKDNIDYEGKYVDEVLKEFLNIFSEIFNKTEFAIFNDLGYKIDANGSNLSEGQKTLIQILRGVIKRPIVLCFDESNAELDDDTEKLLFNILFKNFSSITFIVIAHKLNILDVFDSIIVIEDGRIKEINKPNSILI